MTNGFAGMGKAPKHLEVLGPDGKESLADGSFRSLADGSFRSRMAWRGSASTAKVAPRRQEVRCGVSDVGSTPTTASIIADTSSPSGSTRCSASTPSSRDTDGSEALRRRRPNVPILTEALGSLQSAKPSKGHTHKNVEAGVVTCCISGLICGMVLYAFCSVFAEMIFGQNALLVGAVPLGVSTQTMTAMIGAFVFAYGSSCRAVIAGPDINPVVFLAEAAAIISEKLCPQGYDSCAAEQVQMAVPTVLTATWIATLLVGAAFLSLGKGKLSVVVGFVPASVICGFLSCVGWKVLKASISIATPLDKPLKWKYYVYFFGSWEYSWSYLLPALPVGLPLYLLKRWHIGKPTINFPLFIIAPISVFYGVVFAGGWSIDEAREGGWLFPTSNNSDGLRFWSAWEEMYGGMYAGDVSWISLFACLPSWIVMIFIVVLDNGLKLASTEASLAIDFNYNHEMTVGGGATLLSAVCCGSPAYSQTKFNVLNYGMTRSTSRRLPSLVCGIFNGVLFFSGLPLIDYLPRFVLSGLLLFSAVGFLVDNLWDTRKTYDRANFFSIWAVFTINVIGGEYLPQYGLLISIGSGLLWGLIAFVIQFARHSAISSLTAISGEAHCSSAIRSATQETKLGVLGVWYTILKCPVSYIFFGTASILYRNCVKHVDDNCLRKRSERTKMLIFDMTDVKSMDATAGTVFLKVHRLCAKANICLVWAALVPSVREQLELVGVPLTVNDEELVFASLDKAEKYVEDQLLARVHQVGYPLVASLCCACPPHLVRTHIYL